MGMPNQLERLRVKHPWTNQDNQEIPNTLFLEKLKQRIDKPLGTELNVSNTDFKKLKFPPINEKNDTIQKCRRSAPVHSSEKEYSFESFSTEKTSIGHVPGYGPVKIKRSRVVHTSNNPLGSTRASGYTNHSGYLTGKQVSVQKETKKGVEIFATVPRATFLETTPPKGPSSSYGTALPPIGSKQTTVPGNSSQNCKKKSARMKKQTKVQDNMHSKEMTKFDLDIINSRAKKPPFNTCTDEEASKRFVNHYYG